MSTISAALSPAEARAVFRPGTGATSAGWASGYTQANLVAVPADWAYDVLLFTDVPDTSD